MNCTPLSTRTSFEGYIPLLQPNATLDLSLVTHCRAEICSALWGSGNPDISGIGLAIGYLLESSICLVILCFSVWIEQQPPKNPKLAKMLLANVSKAFFDNAAFFTFAIQAASIATLTRVDFGINADGMGALTMQITWLVSMMTLLPLMLLVMRPGMFRHGESEARDQARQDLRFLFFVVCWAMAFCPFFSRMGGTFGQSKIGDTEGAAISTYDWSLVEDLCFSGVDRMSLTTERFVTACDIMSYLLVSVLVIGKILVSILEGSEHPWLAWLRKFDMSARSVWRTRLHHALSSFIFALLAVHSWAFFRLRQVQKHMNEVAGGDFPDGRWTFGQIVAVTVFVPVFVEAVFSWRKRALYLA